MKIGSLVKLAHPNEPYFRADARGIVLGFENDEDKKAWYM